MIKLISPGLGHSNDERVRCSQYGGLDQKVSEHFMRGLASLGIGLYVSKDLPGWQIQVPCAMDGALELVAYGRSTLLQMPREAMTRNK